MKFKYPKSECKHCGNHNSFYVINHTETTITQKYTFSGKTVKGPSIVTSKTVHGKIAYCTQCGAKIGLIEPS